MFIVHALADYPPLSIDGGNDSIADNNIGDDNLKRHSHTWKNIGTFLRLAVNGDLATAWPFAVEGEAFAHRCLIQMFSRSRDFHHISPPRAQVQSLGCTCA